MNSVEKVKSICKERKIPISKIEKDLGYANGYIGQLRKGTFPSDRLSEIAQYLSVSEKYLMGKDGEEEKEMPDIILSDIEKDFLDAIRSRPKHEQPKLIHAFMSLLETMND